MADHFTEFSRASTGTQAILSAMPAGIWIDSQSASRQLAELLGLRRAQVDMRMRWLVKRGLVEETEYRSLTPGGEPSNRYAPAMRLRRVPARWQFERSPANGLITDYRPARAEA